MTDRDEKPVAWQRTRAITQDDFVELPMSNDKAAQDRAYWYRQGKDDGVEQERGVAEQSGDPTGNAESRNAGPSHRARRIQGEAMSDLVERVARAIYEADDPWHKAWPWPDLQSDQAGVDQYRRIAEAALAAMQADAAPALKPAVEVWREAADASNSPVPCEDADCKDCRAAAAVIEADRAAIIAAKDVEIAALKDAWRNQFTEKVKERDEAKLWFEKAQEWKQSLAALQAHADAMAGALETAKQCEASSFWGADAEKYARAAWRGAFRKVTKALRAYEEFRRG